METKVDLLRQLGDKFGSIADALAAGQSAGEFPERAMAVRLLSNYFRKAGEEKSEGRQLAWINYAVVPELFWAMDITPIVIDALVGVTAQNPQEAMPYIDRAEEHLPDYICSVNKIFLGAALSGHIPVPDMIVVPSHPCDSNLATYPVIAQTLGFPYFCIDAPYFRDERGLQHVTGELKRLVAFLEERTGRRMEYRKLRAAMEYSNRAHESLFKIADLAQTVPSPFSSIDMLTDYALVLALAGTPELVEYLEKKGQTVRQRVERQRGRPTNQKLRLVWIYGAPVFDFGFFFYLERKFGAFSVGNMSNNFIMRPVADLSSTDSILKGLAAKLMTLPMGRECGGPWENYIEAMIDLCSRFKADAAIFAGHIACKANWPIMKLVKDRITDELGIPTLIFELDLMDPRITSGDAMRARFEEFFAVHFPQVVPDVS